MMRRVMVTALAAIALAGCAQQSTPPQASSPPAKSTTSVAPGLPPDPKPTAAGPCPYLDENFVAEANGQRVAKVRTSAASPAGTAHPACFFYALTGKPQLTVRVYVGDAEIATKLIDAAAPVDTSNPADEPAGWRGGYQRTKSGAVYSVAKHTAAVVVTTNQHQSVKARQVAERAITALGL